MFKGKGVRIKNFLSLRDVTLPLKPLTGLWARMQVENKHLIAFSQRMMVDD